MRTLMSRTRARQQGQVLILFAFGFVAMMAFLGLAVDAGNIYVNRRVAQNAADAAALAGVRELGSGDQGDSSGTAKNVAAAGCTFGRINRWGAYTTVSTMEYVGTDGLSGGTGHAL